MHKCTSLFVLVMTCGLASVSCAQQPPARASNAQSRTEGTVGEAQDAWRTQEDRFLMDPVALTARDRFVKAGEAYFDPDSRFVVFQATPVPGSGEPDPFYAMYVAELSREGESVRGLRNIERISPPGSANTCGWFHPLRSGTVIFGSTLTRPSDEQKSGFQVGTRKYVWMFPSEMEIVSRTVRSIEQAVTGSHAKGDASESPAIIFSRPEYDAECSLDASGRFLLYTHVEEHADSPKPDGNIYIYDTLTRRHHPIVVAPGYDGGPFFSPDGRSICYRSDREGNDLLQIFVADLLFKNDEKGELTISLGREWQLTGNAHVNWAPYWHPSGTYLVYGSSEAGHQNYELFAIEADMEKLRAGAAPSGMRHVRITHAPGADILPAFSPDGKWIMWTSQRAGAVAGEQRPSSQLWIARWKGIDFSGGTTAWSDAPQSNAGEGAEPRK